MEHRENEARGQIEDRDRRQNPEHLGVAAGGPLPGEDYRSPETAASRGPGARGSTARRDVASWVNWQSALYAFALGLTCVFLAPLTSLWWLALVFGAIVPIALAMLDKPNLALERSDDKKAKERELLHVLAEPGELTPSTAAMRTSLTVDEASKMLEVLAREGHLRPQAEDGVLAYALQERDRHELPGKAWAPSVPQRLDDPLSERELEVLSLLASGRTNSEVARDLFVSVGTVKSHTGNIYRKLDAKNRVEALARARELDLL